ncbi:MAG: LemA family protein [Dermatophilaceae bacterium]
MGLSWVVGGVALAVLLAWYLSYGAARLDRLHARVEGALSALDAQLVRRAESTLELANSGSLDPASALILAGAASDSLEAEADAESQTTREAIESDLTQALELALGEEALRQLREDLAVGAPALQRVAAANHRVQLARRFLNDAVTDVRRVRRKPGVRLLRLAGHAELPQTFEFDDELPMLGRGA